MTLQGGGIGYGRHGAASLRDRLGGEAEDDAAGGVLEDVAGVGGEGGRVAAAIDAAQAHEDGVELALDGGADDLRAGLAAGDPPLDVAAQLARPLDARARRPARPPRSGRCRRRSSRPRRRRCRVTAIAGSRKLMTVSRKSALKGLPS